MASTLREQEKALTDLGTAIDDCRAQQQQAVAIVAQAASIKANRISGGVAAKLNDLAASSETDPFTVALQAKRTKLMAELDMLTNYATGFSQLGQVLASVDLSAGLGDATVKQNILAAVTAALG